MFVAAFAFLQINMAPVWESIFRVQVCVCAPCSHRDPLGLFCFCFHFAEQGGAGHSGDCTQRSYPLVLEAEPDQLCVPA